MAMIKPIFQLRASVARLGKSLFIDNLTSLTELELCLVENQSKASISDGKFPSRIAFISTNVMNTNAFHISDLFVKQFENHVSLYSNSQFSTALLSHQAAVKFLVVNKQKGKFKG